jgi:hypothetical protein
MCKHLNTKFIIIRHYLFTKNLMLADNGIAKKLGKLKILWLFQK